MGRRNKCQCPSEEGRVYKKSDWNRTKTINIIINHLRQDVCGPVGVHTQGSSRDCDL